MREYCNECGWIVPALIERLSWPETISWEYVICPRCGREIRRRRIVRAA